MAKRSLTPSELLEIAKQGQSLKPRERQAILTWLEKTNEASKYTDADLRGLLGCTQGTLDKLRAVAQRTIALSISPEQAMNYMVDFLRDMDLVIKESKEGCVKSPPGGQLRIGFMRLVMDATSQKIEKLQSIGVIPKELGRLTTVTEEWEATVSSEGVASVQERQGPPDEPVR